MKAGILFSGGKDSSLAAILLSFIYEVELNTFIFSHDTDVTAVQKAASLLKLPHHIRLMRDGVLNEAVDQIIRDGYPNNAIQKVHREAISSLCELYEVVADGTRFGDRIPWLSGSEIQSISDRKGVSYLRPLAGFPKQEVIRLSERYLSVAYGETGTIRNGDYEHEIREAIRSRGLCPASFFPPAHEQSLITGIKLTGE
jgi:tRNA methyltransferase